MTRLSSGRQRHQPKRPLNQIIHIYCEGLSEFYYISWFKHQIRGIGIELKVHKPGVKHQRIQLVQHVIDQANSGERRQEDLVYIIFDADASRTNPGKTAKELSEAIQLAMDNQFIPIVNDDAFELWLLLHFQDVSCATPRDQLARRLQTQLKKTFPKMDEKKFRKPYKDLVDTLNTAVDANGLLRRESALDRADKMPCTGNPSTGMPQLVRKLQSWIEESKNKK